MKDRMFIKGFDKDLKCRGYQFEVGKEYKIDLPEGYTLTKNDLCSDKVFHFCDSLQKVHKHYNCADEGNRFCKIEVLGQFCETEDKCGSNHIKIIREITGAELQIAKGLTNGNSGLFNSGYGNSGNRNSGDDNSGNRNSGNRNSGDDNSGYGNSGYGNSGDGNSGNRNSGIFNKTNCSNGVFCNQEPTICIFNVQTNVTLSEFYKSKYWSAITSSYFPLTEWIEEPNSPTGGKLITRTYQEACRMWWDGMSDKNKAIIKNMPNFDIDVFCDITGIDRSEV